MDQQLINDYRLVFRIRNFEKTILDLFSQNKLTGTTHTCIGQEATPVALMSSIQEKDSIFGSHRSHGYFLSYAKTIKPLLAEIMGKKTGMCRGRGGSQHVCYKNYTTNGVQGGVVPNATGMALAEKLKGTNAIVVALLGDGTMGQGVVYESMNMASIFGAPVLYIIEENAYAMTTPSSYAIAGDLNQRISGFGVKTVEITSNDTFVLRPFFKEAVDYVRNEQKPMCCIVHTYRLGPHSKSDDDRDPQEIAEHQKNDPLELLKSRMNIEECLKIDGEECSYLQQILLECETDEVEDISEIYDVNSCNIPISNNLFNNQEHYKCVNAINKALQKQLEIDNKTILLGEDIRDPYGGAFKATKGLTEKYSSQVWNTPISEAGMVGLGIGMAMRGLKPIVEMMFGDFISLGFDQLLNHAAKYNWMYANQLRVPLIIRTPMGGKRGYGATHSQSLEKYLVGVPGIDVLALSPIIDVEKLYTILFEHIDKPTVVVEDKALYGQRLYVEKDGKIGDFYAKQTESLYPMFILSMDEDDYADVAIITYGGMVRDAMEAAEELMMKDEIVAKIIVLTKISSVDYRQLSENIGNTPIVYVVEPGTRDVGWSSEIITGLVEQYSIQRRYNRICSPNLPIPCNKSLEDAMIPNKQSIYDNIKKGL